MNVHVSQTDLSLHDKYARLSLKIKNRLDYFRSMVDQRTDSDYYFLYVHNLKRFEKKAHKLMSLLPRVSNYFNSKQVVGDIKLERRYHYVRKIVDKWPTRQEHAIGELDITYPEKWSTRTKFGFIWDYLADGAYEQNHLALKTRTAMELHEALENGWYVCFVTLTVDQENYANVFKKGSKAWTMFILEFKRKLGSQIYGSVRDAQDKEYFDYIAVVEDGDENGQLHIHSLFFMKEPLECDDPNFGLKRPINRQIKEYEHMWPYGLCEFKAVRWSHMDPWGMLGWAWPIVSADDPRLGSRDYPLINQPIPSSSIIQLSEYISKYILKSQTNQNERMKQWRTKTSRGLGRKKLDKFLKTMDQRFLIALVNYVKPPLPIMLNGNLAPYKMLRNRALRVLIRSLDEGHTFNVSQKNTLLKMLGELGTQKKPESNRQRIGDMIIRLLNGEERSREYLPWFYKLAGKLNNEFPPSEYWEPVTGGNSSL